ncbi:transposase [Streptomyces sp. NPDC056580]|uniref:transposase n=1 Tax=Streptomyces sp. NPDC056580 TaxID=3345872 RepID=UPI0036BCFAF7
MIFPPKDAVSRLVNSFKGVSPAGSARRSPISSATTGGRNAPWSGPYFAGSVGGAPLSILKQYIDQQNRPL